MSSDPALLLQPIPGDFPEGITARYEPAFVRLENEIAKLGALDGGPVNWRAIAADAADILTNTSKDLLAAVYLTRAWHEIYGVTGLRDGLTVAADVLITYWDTGFPPLTRLRARRAALQWLSDGLTSITPTDDSEALAACLSDCSATVERMHQHLLPHVDDGDTGLGGLRRTIKQNLSEYLSGESSSDSSDETPAANAGTSRTARSTMRTGSSRTDGDIDRAEAMHRLRTAAEWFLRIEPHSPVGYLAQRAADLGSKPFHAVFRELLANHPPAQQELWHVLGIPAEPGI